MVVIDSVVSNCVHLRSISKLSRTKTDTQLMTIIMTNVWGNYFSNHLIYISFQIINSTILKHNAESRIKEIETKIII